MSGKKSKTAPRSRRPIAMPKLPAMDPKDVTEQKARNLPMFGPGIVITVPLHLMPSYFKLYHLVPKGMSASGILHVQREVPEKRHE